MGAKIKASIFFTQKF